MNPLLKGTLPPLGTLKGPLPPVKGLQPIVRTVMPAAGKEETQEPTSTRSVLDELPQPAPRRRLRPQGEIVDEEKREQTEKGEEREGGEGGGKEKEKEKGDDGVEEISSTVTPTYYSPSTRPRVPKPLDVRAAFGPPKEEEEVETIEAVQSSFPFDEVRSPTGEKGKRAVGALFGDGPMSPVRSPSQGLWDSFSGRSNTDPLSPTGSNPETKPKRRLSQWLAEDLDMKMIAEREEKKLAEEKKLRKQNSRSVDETPPPDPSKERRTSINEEPNELIKAAQKEAEKHRSRTGNRRESIKVHLQRIKQKAGKVLEEVHDRFTEDHSSSSVAPTDEPIKSPLPMSPKSPTSPELPPEERITSPTPSVTSKRTVTSAEMKDKMRSKIRKQAEKVVERTRGSVQLTRRLQRRQTIHTVEGPTEEEIGNVDEHIEKSLKMGSKFVQEAPSRLHSEAVQLAFFTDTFPKEKKAENVSIEYVPAWPSKDPPETMFTVYERGVNDVETGDGTTVTISPSYPMNIHKMEQRVGRAMLDREGKLARIDKKLSKTPMKYVPATEDPPVVYMPAISWQAAKREGAGTKFVQLDVDVGKVQFAHHWLVGEEDSISLHLWELYEEQLEAAQLLTNTGQIISEKRNEAELIGEDIELDPLYNTAESAHKHLVEVIETMKREYTKLRELRETRGYSVTKTRMREADSGHQMEDEPFALRNLFILTEDHETTPIDKLPKEEQERINAVEKCQLQVSIHFNEILVYRTSAKPLDNTFNVNFGQLYNLEVYSIPETITLTIAERFGKSEFRILCTVGIPLPDETTFTEMNNPAYRVHFASDQLFDRYRTALGANGKESGWIRGYISCNATWSKRGEMKQRLDRRRMMDRRNSAKDEEFYLIPPATRLVSDEEFNSDLRLEVLSYRYQKRLWNNPLYKRIPLDSADVDSSLLLSNERKLSRDNNYRYGIDDQRMAGARYATLLRSQLLERFTQTERVKSYEDMVREEPIPTLFGAFGSLFGPVDQSRKLKPMRRVVQRAQNGVSSTCNLIINIQSALNLPLRTNGTVEPYVEVVFQKNEAKTTVASGKSPTWQQTMTMPVERFSNEDTDLKMIVDYVELNIYDQVVSQLDKDEREPNSIHEQLLKRYIGTVRIPFSTIYCRGKIDGHLRIQLPMFFTGYKFSDRPCYLKVLIALDPPLLPPRLLPPILNGSIETDTLVSQCLSWQKFCSSQYEDRRYVALVSDSNGKKVLASRYLRSIRPPPPVQQVSSNVFSAAALACRIVSYIPFVSDPVLFPGVSDVWTTVEQFLSMGCGDEEEHAVLLCCWVMSLGLSSNIILGTALPEGDKAAFVLSMNADGNMLMNPTDGNVYTLDDPLCPLLSVGTVITPSNVYGNIQPYAHPSHIKWDFKKATEWRPLFEKERPPLPSVQPDTVTYAEIREDTMVELRSNIEREIKMKFDEARQYGIPQWNLLASRTLREILQESDSGYPSNVEDKLSRLRDSFDVCVTASHQPYDSLPVCVSLVLRTLLHVNSDPSVQFALAVHVQPFFNNIGIPQWNLLASRTLREILQESDSGYPSNVEDKLSRLRDSFEVCVTASHQPYDSLPVCVSLVLRTLLHVNSDPSVQFALAVHVQPFFNNIVSCSIAVGSLTAKH